MIICLERVIKISLMLDLRELGFERLLRRALHVRVERGVDKQAAVVDLVLRENQVQIALDRVHRVIFLDLKQAPGVGINLGELGLGRFRRGNFFNFNHPIQHRVAFVGGAFRIF